MQYRFGDYQVHVERRELTRSGHPIAIEPQVFDLLVHIIHHRDRVLSKDDLIDGVWGGRVVSNATLASRINAVRKAVGDSGEAQDLIRTYPRKGIRFIGEVLEQQPVAAMPAAPVEVRTRPSIAVLPFENLSSDSNQDYFADGMVAEIVTGLSRIKWLFVISRNSTSVYKGRPVDVRVVGHDLGVRYVLEGSVQRSGDQVRVTGQLVETETAAQVWAERYEGTLASIFALQDEMTMHVIGALEPTLRKAEIERARRRRPDSLDAYDLFLRAMPFASTAMPDDAERALSLLEEAIKLEPEYAAAHGFLAWCHEQRYLRGGLRSETREAARNHAHIAIKTGSDDAMALSLGGFVVAAMERDYDTALEAIDRALSLSPSLSLAFGFSSIIRAWRGDTSLAVEHGRMAIRLSPHDPLIYLPYVGLAYAGFFDGDFAKAAAAAAQAAASNPDFSVPRYLHAASAFRLGKIDEAKESASILMRLQPAFTVSGLVAGNITDQRQMEPLARALLDVGLPE
jgi:TolB-like protein